MYYLGQSILVEGGDKMEPGIYGGYSQKNNQHWVVKQTKVEGKNDLDIISFEEDEISEIITDTAPKHLKETPLTTFIYKGRLCSTFLEGEVSLDYILKNEKDIIKEFNYLKRKKELSSQFKKDE